VLTKPRGQIAEVDSTDIVVVALTVELVAYDGTVVILALAILVALVLGVRNTVIAIERREAALLSKKLVLARVVRLAVVVRAFTIVRAIVVYLATTGQIRIRPVTADVVDARIQVAVVPVVALCILVAASRIILVNAQARIIAAERAQVDRADLAIVTVIRGQTAPLSRNMRAHGIHAFVGRAQVPVIKAEKLRVVQAAVIGIQNVLAKVALTVVDGGRVLVVPHTSRTTVRVNETTVRKPVLLVGADIDFLAQIVRARIAVVTFFVCAGFAVIAAFSEIGNTAVPAFVSHASVQSAYIVVIAFRVRLLLAAERVNVAVDACLGRQIAAINRAIYAVVAFAVRRTAFGNVLTLTLPDLTARDCARVVVLTVGIHVAYGADGIVLARNALAQPPRLAFIVRNATLPYSAVGTHVVALEEAGAVLHTARQRTGITVIA